MIVKNGESPLPLSRLDKLKEECTKAESIHAFPVRVIQFVTFLLTCLYVKNAESQLGTYVNARLCKVSL